MAKVTKEILEEMKRLSNQGVSQKEIGKRVGLFQSTVCYHLTETTKERVKLEARIRSRNLTPEQRKESYKKRYLYTKKYIMDRYHNDPEFRKKFIQCQIKSKAKRQAVWKLDDSLCNRCGKRMQNSEYQTCERCRERKRLKYYRKKNSQ